MNKDAIFSDEINYSFRLRTYKKDDIKVYLCTEDSKTLMVFEKSQGEFSYWKYPFEIPKKKIEYYFRIEDASESVIFDRCGFCDEPRPQYWFSYNPDFKVPNWSKGAVMYQIFVDRFARGSKENDVQTGEYYYTNSLVNQIQDWNEPPKAYDVINFYGGDLGGVLEKLSYLKSLGIEVIYLNPIFLSPSNHKYDTQDYDYVDPHFTEIINDGGDNLTPGENDNKKASRYIKRVTDINNLEASNRFFANFVKTLHEKGFKVIIDGVFNHCGSFNKWMDKEGIYQNKEGFAPGAAYDISSPYRDFFKFDDKESFNYEGWWGYDTLPKLNYEESEKLCEYILSIGKKWVSPPYNVDGWRLDVAADLGHSEEFNHSFWKRFRKAVKEANPEAIILAEHYGDASSWLQGDEWDTLMNYDAFMDPVSYFLTGIQKHSDGFNEELLGNGEEFERSMRHNMGRLNAGALLSAMNELSNHDHSRFLTRTNHKVGRVGDLGSEAAGEDIDLAVFRQGVLMQMTWPGAPTVYYADEAGQVGFTDPDSRRTYPWGEEKDALIDYHRDCISIHKTYSALKQGSFMFLKCEGSLVSFARFFEHQKIIVVINAGNDTIEAKIPVWKTEIPDGESIRSLIITNRTGYSIAPKDYGVTQGNATINLGANSAIVCKWEKDNGQTG